MSLAEKAELGFDELLAAERPRLLAFLTRTCGDGRDAEDVLQETLLRAHRARHQLVERGQFRAWIYTIARHTCQRLHRKRAGAPEHVESLEELLAEPLPPPASWFEAVVENPEDPEHQREREEARERIEAALDRVPDPFRKALVLGEIAELSVAEIAQVLGLKQATVKTRLHRGRLYLRRALEQAGGAAPPASRRGGHVCRALLEAKMEALDRGVPFPYPEEALCERCRAVFRGLELARALCRGLDPGKSAAPSARNFRPGP